MTPLFQDFRSTYGRAFSQFNHQCSDPASNSIYTQLQRPLMVFSMLSSVIDNQLSSQDPQ